MASGFLSSYFGALGLNQQNIKREKGRGEFSSTLYESKYIIEYRSVNDSSATLNQNTRTLQCVKGSFVTKWVKKQTPWCSVNTKTIVSF